jgi:hypothetical protein
MSDPELTANRLGDRGSVGAAYGQPAPARGQAGGLAPEILLTGLDPDLLGHRKLHEGIRRRGLADVGLPLQSVDQIIVGFRRQLLSRVYGVLDTPEPTRTFVASGSGSA